MGTLNDKDELLMLLGTKDLPGEVMKAFSMVPREDFVSYQLRGKAYEDTALPIGHGQTISQPSTIATMLSELDLKPKQKVLEVGSGSGYVLALISSIVGSKGKVVGIEVIKELAEKSKENFEGRKHIKIYHNNGSVGAKEEGPFDRILVSAAIHAMPEKLISQLKVGGILVAPKGSRFEQEIVVIRRKSKTELEILKRLPGYLFVPFVED